MSDFCYHRVNVNYNDHIKRDTICCQTIKMKLFLTRWNFDPIGGLRLFRRTFFFVDTFLRRLSNFCRRVDIVATFSLQTLPFPAFAFVVGGHFANDLTIFIREAEMLTRLFSESFRSPPYRVVFFPKLLHFEVVPRPRLISENITGNKLDLVVLRVVVSEAEYVVAYVEDVLKLITFCR